MKLSFRVHAIQRMFQRYVTKADVQHIVTTGETIEEYPNDTPYPSRLMLGWRGVRPLHIVIAENKADDEIIVITVYEPDPIQWSADFRERAT